MYLQKCEHPKRIWNKYTKEFIYVPCGKCNSCLKSRSNRWVERLNVERKCWKYCLFFTLTYSQESVPVLVRKDHYLVDLSHKHQAPGSDCVFIDIPDWLSTHGFSDQDIQKSLDFTARIEKIPYLSVYDIQCFIKRLKKHLHKNIINTYGKSEATDEIVRYYIVGEYGSTTKRSHYHGQLFFSSEREASQIEKSLREAWKLGIVDSSFVSSSNAAYVAKYLNCISDLPAIFGHPEIKPFSVFSKATPIGTLYFQSDQIREIFDKASPSMLVDYFNDLKLHDVPLWRTLEDFLFPKLPLFSKLTSYDRRLLYNSVFNSETRFGFENGVGQIAKRFLNNHQSQVFTSWYLHTYDDYISALADNISDKGDLLNSVIRWLSKSSRVINQAAVFGVSVDGYVAKIEEYYNNQEQEKLSLQYRFMQEFSDKYDTVIPLVGIDRIFLESVLDVDLCDMSLEELTILEGFGIDIEKFTSQDLSERYEYYSQLIPENTLDYIIMQIDNAAWSKKALKTKKKNDYLLAHPELNKLYGDYVENLDPDNLPF